jgi:alkylation response protein AidB-like acyl-CoA dehydrogenase
LIGETNDRLHVGSRGWIHHAGGETVSTREKITTIPRYGIGRGVNRLIPERGAQGVKESSSLLCHEHVFAESIPNVKNRRNKGGKMTTAAIRILQAVQDLAPTINTRAPEIETARRIPPDLLQDLIAAGCFRMLVPQSYGGDEIDLLSSIDILETLATADGATGWTVMIGCETPMLFALLPRRQFDDIYATSPDVIVGGAFAPQGEARVVDGGYRATGRWGFASGCQHCHWLFGNCVVTENGQPRPGPFPNTPELKGMLLPANEVEIIDTWKTAGLRGTGSHDIAMTDHFVPTDQTVDIFFGQPTIPGPLFAIALPVFSLHIGTVALGIAQGAFNDLVSFIETKKQRLYARATLADTPLVQYRLGHSATSLRAARSFLRAEAERLWQSALAGERSTARSLNTRILTTVAWVVQTCTVIVDTCYTVGGGPAVYEASPLQRRLRDIHTLTQHASVSEGAFTRAGAEMAGQEVGFGF